MFHENGNIQARPMTLAERGSPCQPSLDAKQAKASRLSPSRLRPIFIERRALKAQNRKKSD